MGLLIAGSGFAARTSGIPLGIMVQHRLVRWLPDRSLVERVFLRSDGAAAGEVLRRATEEPGRIFPLLLATYRGPERPAIGWSFDGLNRFVVTSNLGRGPLPAESWRPMLALLLALERDGRVQPITLLSATKDLADRGADRAACRALLLGSPTALSGLTGLYWPPVLAGEDAIGYFQVALGPTSFSALDMPQASLVLESIKVATDDGTVLLEQPALSTDPTEKQWPAVRLRRPLEPGTYRARGTWILTWNGGPSLRLDDHGAQLEVTGLPPAVSEGNGPEIRQAVAASLGELPVEIRRSLDGDDHVAFGPGSRATPEDRRVGIVAAVEIEQEGVRWAAGTVVLAGDDRSGSPPGPADRADRAPQPIRTIRSDRPFVVRLTPTADGATLLAGRTASVLAEPVELVVEPGRVTPARLRWPDDDRPPALPPRREER
jgi:hypothetical protein